MRLQKMKLEKERKPKKEEKKNARKEVNKIHREEKGQRDGGMESYRNKQEETRAREQKEL